MHSIARYCGLGAVLAAVSLVTACGAGNGSNFGAVGSDITPSAQSGQATSSALQAMPFPHRRKERGEAEVVIRIPHKKHPHRLRPQYVSANTQSMTVSVGGVPTQIFNLTSTSKGCFVKGGYTTCVETAFFPTGRQTVSIALYDQTDAKGNVLSQASESVNVAPSAITNITITLDGVPATAEVLLAGTIGGTNVPEGKPTSMPVTLTAYDADHNIIMSPGDYSSPITLADSDTSGATKLSATSVKTPGQTITLTYNGAAVSSATITPTINGAAQSSGAATLNVRSAPLAPTIAEYDVPTFNSELEGITTGPDDALWFTEYGSGKVGRLTTSGTLTEYSLHIHGQYDSDGPAGITTGPDGALWFTESCPGWIGRITTSGTLTEYSLPLINDVSGGPNGITVGPDGALWFAQAQGEIGRITTTGAITDYSVPTSGALPWGITSGPDGALWFTECQASKIGRITTSGAITEYTLPVAGSYPNGITAGPDGALWFAESLPGRIGRITTSGALTEYSIPVSAGENSGPVGITVGPDGAMWFADYSNNSLGRITTGGFVVEYPTPGSGSGSSGSEPYWITPGPGGTLWMTQFGTSQIASITLPPSAFVRRHPARVSTTTHPGLMYSQAFPLSSLAR
jgi:virginiamycin B lyase